MQACLRTRVSDIGDRGQEIAPCPVASVWSRKDDCQRHVSYWHSYFLRLGMELEP